MKKFIEEILRAITTGDEKEDEDAINMFAETIALQQNVTIEQAREQLHNLRKEYYENRKKGMDDKKATSTIAWKVYKGSLIVIKASALTLKGFRAAALVGSGGAGVAMAGSAIIGPIAWSFVGLVYIAETGINYRRYRQGHITKDEFKGRVRAGAIGTVGGLAGASAGAAVGFLAGSAAFPVVGSIVGVLLGGVVGGLVGRKLSLKTLTAVEKKLAKNKDRKRD